MPTVDITSLAESAIIYQKDLQMLPFAILRNILGVHGFNMFPNVQNKHVLSAFERKRGIAKPYVADDTSNSDLGKAIQRSLEVHPAYASVKDNIRNYKTIAVGPDDLLGKNQSKKHPWEMVMLTSVIRTFTEDIADALFAGKYDTDDKSPTGCFDGIDELIDLDIAAGLIAAAKGNYEATSAIVKPTSESDIDAFKIMLEFYRAAHPRLKAENTILMVPIYIAEAYSDAYFNKFRNKPTIDEYNRTILEGSNGKCRIIGSEYMGSGNRMILTVPGNIDFGMNTESDDQFVQVRNPYEDPNYVQFWIQADYGMRIRSINQKMFMVNDGTPVASALSGDYS